MLGFLLTRSKFYREFIKEAERTNLESFLKGHAVLRRTLEKKIKLKRRQMQFLRTVRHDYGVITPLIDQYRSPARARAQAALVRFTVSRFYGAQLLCSPIGFRVQNSFLGGRLMPECLNWHRFLHHSIQCNVNHSYFN